LSASQLLTGTSAGTKASEQAKMKLHHEELQWLLGVLTDIGTGVVPPRQTGNPLPTARYPLKM
jgi:hypothetical protein